MFIRCRKLNVSLCFLTQSYFSVSKTVRLNCIHYIIFKLNNKRKLQNIAINHSADIDYKDFVNIYRDCIKEPYNVLTIDATQLTDKRFKNNFNGILQNNKIRSNQAQYDLDRQNAKISALCSDELDKYECLTGEDLGYKPDVVQKGKFEYSPLGQVFHKGLEKDEKQVGLLKRLKNIEDNTDNQLNENKDSQLGSKPIDYDIKKSFSPEGMMLLKQLSIRKKRLATNSKKKQVQKFVLTLGCL